MTYLYAPWIVLALAAGQTALVPMNDLDVVRGHYAAAAYEEALSHIAEIEAGNLTPSVEQYRALCLLALGRMQEGEAAFERLVRQSPGFVIPEGDISPRLLVVFRDVRRRVLPDIAADAYERGKIHFDAGEFGDAVLDLREVGRLLDDPDLVAVAADHSDLRQLADGFLRLAEMSQAAASKRPTAGPAGTVAGPEVVSAPRTASATADTATTVVFSADDKDVTPPVEESRTMPVWDPPAVMARYLEYRGEIAVVVDERGRVAAAEVTRRTIPSYDVTLVAATDTWRFQPARRDGQPVRYRLTFEFVLAPTR